MKWNDSIFTGTHNGWHWAVPRHQVPHLDVLVVTHFKGLRLCIIAFDGGPIKPTSGELTKEWLLVDEVMVSPPLSSDLEIPCDTRDEWAILEQVPRVMPSLDRFVNCGGFNLADPRQLTATFDPTWESSGLDWLYPLQQRFWHQVELLNPSAYVISGDNDLVVSHDQAFVRKFLESAKRSSR